MKKQKPIPHQVDAVVMSDILSSKHKRLKNITGILKQHGLWAKLDFLFWKTLCPYPDQTKIGMWWYGVSGRIAGYFHRKHCKRCKNR